MNKAKKQRIDEAYEGFYPILEKVLKEDAHAISFIKELFIGLHLWDDLVDKDKKLTDTSIRQAFWSLLVTLPLNPFYRQHISTLHPILLNAILNWETANYYELHGSGNDLRIAFILRSSFIDLVSMSALLIGGADWARDANIELRRLEHSEGFDHYVTTVRGEDYE